MSPGGQSWRRTICVAAAALAWMATPGRAGAQSAPPLTDDDFRLDLNQGPVLGSTRVVGLGGAYTSIAEGAVGLPFNPASAAHRAYYSESRFDWDLSIDFLIPGIFQSSDFDYDNNGRSATSASIAYSAGALIQYGSFGFGIAVRGQMFDFQRGASRAFNVALALFDLSVAYALFDHQVIVGAGLRVGMFDMRAEPNREKLLELRAAGGRGGVLVRPKALPLRIAAMIASSLTSGSDHVCTSARCPDGFLLPDSVAMPWEVRLGASYRIGPGTYNPAPSFEGARKRSAPSSAPAQASASSMERRYRGGRYLLFAVDLLLQGRVDNAIGTDGFFEQIRERSGTSWTFSPRLGVESEIFRRRLRARLGSYFEPSRFAADDRIGRLHGTFSFDLRLFDFRLWGPRSLTLASAVDVAERYSNLSFSLGFWH